MNSLSIDIDTFKKVSKRLKLQLNDKSLAESQEILAKSLGFRNLNGLNTFFTKTDIKPNKIEELSSDFYIYLYELFHEGYEMMWGERIKQLLLACVNTRTVCKSRSYKFDPELNLDNPLDFQALKQLTSIDLMIKIVDDDKFEPSEIKDIAHYVNNVLPKETKIEQHNFLANNIHTFLNRLDRIFKEEIKLIDLNWFDMEFKETKGKLNQDRLNELFKFPDQAWHTMPHGMRTKVLLQYELTYDKRIEYTEELSNSWLADSDFKEFLTSLLQYKKLRNLMLWDLVSESYKVINKEKKNLYKRVINLMIENCDESRRLSKFFDALTKD